MPTENRRESRRREGAICKGGGKHVLGGHHDTADLHEAGGRLERQPAARRGGSVLLLLPVELKQTVSQKPCFQTSDLHVLFLFFTFQAERGRLLTFGGSQARGFPPLHAAAAVLFFSCNSWQEGKRADFPFGYYVKQLAIVWDLSTMSVRDDNK